MNFFEIATFIILAVSALASTWLFYSSKNKEREKETFDYIDDKFNEFLKMCLDKPYLDVFDVADTTKMPLDPLQQKEEKVAFAYLMSIFERVYIFYVQYHKKCDDDQFTNWTKTIKEYFRRDNFRDAWRNNGYGWDPGFIHFMDDLFLRTKNVVVLEEIDSLEGVETWYKSYENHFIQDHNNDDYDHIKSYFYDHSKFPYQFYHIKNNHGEIVGGILTQEINKAVFILYIFVNVEHQKHGYGGYALRTLRSMYDEKSYFIAEVEKRNIKKKPWWESNLFEQVSMTYMTPEVNLDTFEEIEAKEDNDLMIFASTNIKPSHFSKSLIIYFKTSFVHNIKLDISQYISVKKNSKQILSMKNNVKTK